METIFPSIGVITSTLIGISPYDTVQTIIANPSAILKDHNVYPYPMIFNNFLAWLLYSLLVHDSFIFWSNSIGFLFAGYYLISVYSQCWLSGYLAKCRRILQVWVCGMAVAWGGAFISFLCVPQGDDDLDGSGKAMGQNVMGTTCIVLLIMFYTSPLAAFGQVIRTRDSSLFSMGLSITCGVNALVWVLYGVLKQDLYIWGPNIVGLVVSVVQLLCIMIYPSSSAHHASGSSGYSRPGV